MLNKASYLKQAYLILYICACYLIVYSATTSDFKSRLNLGRYAEVEALADYATFDISKSSFHYTIDRASIGGRFVSAKPPMLSLIAVPFYKVFSIVTGQRFRDAPKASVTTTNILLGLISFIGLLIYYKQICLLLGFDPKYVFYGTLLFCFTYLGLAYSTVLNRHSFAAFTLVACLFHTLKLGQLHSKIRHVVLAAIFAALSVTIDYVTGFVIGAMLIYALVKISKMRVVVYSVLFAGVCCLHLFVMFVKTGQFLPLILVTHLGTLDYPGSYWITESRMSDMDLLGRPHNRQPRLVYMYHTLVGHHGIFSMTPVLVFGVLSFFIKKTQNMGQKAFFHTLLVAVALTYLVLVFKTFNYGGVCVGFRFILSVIPIFYLLLPAIFEKLQHKALAFIFCVACLISLANNLAAFKGPFRHSKWHDTLWPVDRK